MSRLELRERILTCERCELHATSRGPVPFSGPSPAPFAILGEAPGASEDQGGEPFVGRAGQLLRKVLADAGVDVAQAFICNTVCCFPKGTPRPGAIVACRENLWDQLALSAARYVLALGSIPLHAFRTDLRMTTVHGQVFSRSGRQVFTTFHPAAALRRPDWHDAMVADLMRFGAAMKQQSWVGLTIELCAYCRKPEEEMAEIFFDGDGLPFCEQCWPGSPGGQAAKRPTPPAPLPSHGVSQALPTVSIDEAVAMVQAEFAGAELVSA